MVGCWMMLDGRLSYSPNSSGLESHRSRGLQAARNKSSLDQSSTQIGYPMTPTEIEKIEKQDPT